ncbi:MAG: radical SAM protein [Prevotellaceae bacterium]|jgi:hypothetical protein|nr:radical SAM protein [Prevotellaceae bacterium]
MKIGLIDIDGHNFPNIALMKIAMFHKKQGDHVEWVNYFKSYDKVYTSKVFTFTPDVSMVIQADEIERGGTGYDIIKKLPAEIDRLQPDYSIYPNLDNKTAYGFLTRGCVRNCSWCIVPKKEGTITPYMDIEEILQGRKNAILMDNNILACDYGLQQLEKIAKIGCRVDFNQGLDARLITTETAQLLSQIKWIRHIRFACDCASQKEPLSKAVSLLKKHKINESRIFVYILLTDLNDSHERIEMCKEMNINPFAQPYRNFTPNQTTPQWQQDMARWCNNKIIFQSCDFKDFQPRKGFYCIKYFNNL